MKFILLLLLLLLNILTDVAQGIVIIPTKIQLSNSNLFWALDGSNVILSPNGIKWAIYNNEISPYGNDTVAVQYQGPGKQLAIANKGGPVEILEKWDVGSIIEPQIIPNVTICSIPVPSECATADGMKVIANDKHTAGDPNQLWTLESHF
ncbi:hypothetical protein RhiirA5_356422 [Rhizophagus irregularis]|uniref:Ricin B lectin domain-containing protein n=1 Tax=Rhizophagus irregularis TaxID=588596 RepID=A0A2I1EEI7_9GLOM|nr:hypothetical protein RhiirA5_356422 [Rhizophagus irregularis]PKC66723.1 hypothetical protein RhiirA1_418982 [Rhizophagus irregularis]PKY20534.1 hypothetical protein RhiirB3_408396 [Rhizophagus irregularis]CAB4480985.1 unnamed protein product [Rhizophagus irregularis]CAB5179802.1 unnamed protein product [Rhizophagus irregularis]